VEATNLTLVWLALALLALPIVFGGASWIVEIQREKRERTRGNPTGS
jgi:hypothetical protein